MNFLDFKRLWLWPLWLSALVGYLAVIAFFSLWEFTGPASDIPHLDKIQHFCAYSLLGLVWAQLVPARLWKQVVIASFSYSLLMECLQGLTSYRTFEFYDLLVNFLGASFGAFVSSRVLGELLLRLDSRLKHYLARKRL